MTASSKADRRRARRRDALLWVGALSGPAISAAHFGLSYLLVRPSMRYGSAAPIQAATLIALILIGAGALLSWSMWRAVGAAESEIEGRTKSRSRFMALGGLGLSAFCGLLVVAVAIPSFIHTPWDY
jgi:hypothetical protein